MRLRCAGGDAGLRGDAGPGGLLLATDAQHYNVIVVRASKCHYGYICKAIRLLGFIIRIIRFLLRIEGVNNVYEGNSACWLVWYYVEVDKLLVSQKAKNALSKT